MSDELSIEAIKARLLKQVAEQFDRDMADAARLANKYPDLLQFASSGGKSEAPAKVETQEAQKTENQPTGQSLETLVQKYRTDERSPYQRLRHKTRENYDSLLRRLERDLPEQIENLHKGRIERAHTQWVNASGVSMAHALVTMLRALSTFGSTILKDRACRELRITLHDMDFPMGGRRTERLTRDQAIAIRRKARDMGRPSIALAQALQFDCGLRQKDVIGEWVPKHSEPGEAAIQHRGFKWLRGLRWEGVDSDLTLQYTASISGKEARISLRSTRMVLEELMLIYGLDEMEVFDRSNLPPSGPIVLCEFDALPWTAYEFRRWWRKIADACGISRDVKNMDSRPRISETGNTHAGNGKINSVPQNETPKVDIRQEDLAHGVRH